MCVSLQFRCEDARLADVLGMVGIVYYTSIYFRYLTHVYWKAGYFIYQSLFIHTKTRVVSQSVYKRLR